MYRWSELFIPTLREAPADAEVASHKFLVRAGYVRQLGAGIYSYLFLGQRSILKISNIVRKEMDKIAQEFYLPAHPSARGVGGQRPLGGDGRQHVQAQGPQGRRPLPRHDRRRGDDGDRPQGAAQLQAAAADLVPDSAKFRDEPRPKSGLLRTRQFTMKDAYSFDLDAAGLDVSYQKHYEAYCRIF